MIVDFGKLVDKIDKYIKSRIDEKVKNQNASKEKMKIKMIEFGFEFGQGNQMWLFFDERKNASPDGHWTTQLDKIKPLNFKEWPIWHKLSCDERVIFIDESGKETDITDNPDVLGCKIIGKSMKSAIMRARKAGLFNDLFLHSRCELGVENMEGYYGWPKYEKRGHDNLVFQK